MSPISPPVSGDAATLASLLARHGRDPHALVQMLRELQAPLGWLPRDSLRQLAEALGLTLAHVQGVAGFYRFLHQRPVGEYRVLFSDNVTDRLLGSAALMLDLCRRLGVAPGRLGADGLVSVERTSCTGLCDQGPALLVNHHHAITNLDAERVAQLAGLIRQRLPPGSRCGTTCNAPMCCWAKPPRRVRRWQRRWRAAPRPRWPKSSAPGCVGAAAPGSPPPPNGRCAARPPVPSMW
jgi:NADH:ubiquinone oxidoreductase subunit E